MLVDNPLAQPYFSSTVSYNDFTDLSDIFHTELFTNPSSASTSSGSRASSPRSPTSDSYHTLLTPPPSSCPDVNITDSPYSYGPNSAFFNFGLDDDKTPIEYHFLGSSNPNIALDMAMLMPIPTPSTSPSTSTSIGIDPQLVGTPLPNEAATDLGDHTPQDKDENDNPALSISPVKVGGHGKARKGTVQGGGVTKKQLVSSSSSAFTSSSSSLGSTSAAQDKENTGATAKQRKSTKSKSTTASKSTTPSNPADPYSADPDPDDDDLPIDADPDPEGDDWRPSPEVFQKMTSKERRQLRNKISARNFRVRRKGE